MRTSVLLVITAMEACSQSDFAGAVGGIATLSADARSSGSPPEQFSMYKPENGPTAIGFAGRHFTDYLSVQGSYGWNRNSFVMTGGDLTAPGSPAYDVPMRGTLHTVAADGMLYFRSRRSFARPYLAAGPGLLRFSAEQDGPLATRGNPQLPRTRFHSTQVALRVAVGIDLRIRGGLNFRYSFAETIHRNPISRELRPAASRGLANFQNLWGALWVF